MVHVRHGRMHKSLVAGRAAWLPAAWKPLSRCAARAAESMCWRCTLVEHGLLPLLSFAALEVDRRQLAGAAGVVSSTQVACRTRRPTWSCTVAEEATAGCSEHSMLLNTRDWWRSQLLKRWVLDACGSAERSVGTRCARNDAGNIFQGLVPCAGLCRCSTACCTVHFLGRIRSFGQVY